MFTGLLDKCKNLKSMHLSPTQTGNSSREMVQWAILLSSAPSSLTSVELSGSWSDTASLEQLASVLNCVRFPRLEKVTLCTKWAGRSHREVVTAAEMENVFADLQEKGILSIVS